MLEFCDRCGCSGTVGNYVCIHVPYTAVMEQAVCISFQFQYHVLDLLYTINLYIGSGVIMTKLIQT